MARVSVRYEFTNTYECEIHIPDGDVHACIEEWRQDHEEGWEPTQEDYDRALLAVAEDDYSEHRDPECDMPVGFGDYGYDDDAEIIDHVLPPTYSELNPEVPGQEEMSL